MQPVRDRVGGDVEHNRDLGNGELLPRGEQEYLDIGATEACDSVVDDPAGIVVENRLVSGRRGLGDGGADSGLEPSIPGRASPLVANHVVGRPVQPDQRRIAIGHLV